jgi:hypothetical protein
MKRIPKHYLFRNKLNIKGGAVEAQRRRMLEQKASFFFLLYHTGFFFSSKTKSKMCLTKCDLAVALAQGLKTQRKHKQKAKCVFFSSKKNANVHARAIPV